MSRKILLFPLTVPPTYAVVDDSDFGALAAHSWNATTFRKSRVTYATRNGDAPDGRGRRTIYMHRELLGLGIGDKLIVDHINGDGLDNRRENLRIASAVQSAHNRGVLSTSSTGKKGIWWEARRARWRARITVSGRRFNIGSFATEEEAMAAYRDAAKKLLGDFAHEASPEERE